MPEPVPLPGVPALIAAREFLEKYGTFGYAHGPAVFDSYNLEDINVALLATAFSDFAQEERTREQAGMQDSPGQ